jgi:hypothetical protein
VTLPAVDVTTSALKGILEPAGRMERFTGKWGKMETVQLIVVRMNPGPASEYVSTASIPGAMTFAGVTNGPYPSKNDPKVNSPDGRPTAAFRTVAVCAGKRLAHARKTPPETSILI